MGATCCGWNWIIILVIGAVAVIKVVVLILHGKNQRATPVNDTPSREEKITQTGPMVYYANNSHNLKDKEYQFNYKKVEGSWRAYILRTPSLGNRETRADITHRHFDNGKPFICWETEVETLEDMQTISRVWADSIQEYIATGKRFG